LIGGKVKSDQNIFKPMVNSRVAIIVVNPLKIQGVQLEPSFAQSYLASTSIDALYAVQLYYEA
jgi:hypothetical protein